ncbi:MAG: GH36-type glycosyl hydrolase domain-containing protein, partial [Planctomycetota bacterium]
KGNLPKGIVLPTGAVWTPTPAPVPGEGAYQVRHEAGRTTFLHHGHGLVQELTVFAARDDPVKVARLRLRNTWSRPRRLTATWYVAWVLGARREETAAGLVPDFDPQTQSLLVRSPLDPAFAARTAFLATDRDVHGLTTDRREFLGRLGDVARPEGHGTVGPSGRGEAGCDPCGVLQIHIEVPPGGETTCHFVLGQGEDRDEALALARRWRNPRTVEEGLEAVERFWEETLGALRVETPDPAMDLLLNRWLPYQTLSCRIWGRTALYQSSGAIGFRDQLQDVLAFLPTWPQLARAQILDAAAHQFTEGDVLHWWHPPGGQGVRTRCSDDLLWLPYATAAYVEATGDDRVLDERVPWLLAPPLDEDEKDRYGRYDPAPHPGTLLEHGRRAIERALRFGEHGLLLIGAGDWNDGMNRVGTQGRGESVWLTWFCAATCRAFAPLLDRRGDEEGASELRETARRLVEAIDAHAWDGAWYRRAWFDDGTPLGSRENTACRIDAVAQAWAVLAGGGEASRAREAMDSVEEYLVRPAERLVLLLAPPFGAEETVGSEPAADPGYIAAYPPGIRENGGQYTHAAAWVGLAWAALARREGEEPAPAGPTAHDRSLSGRAETIFRLLNPIHRTLEAEGLERYGVEPYVLAADIAGPSPHVGRGGWTWYTGSAAWLRRLGLEGILGLRVERGRARLAPCVPRAWKRYTIDLRRGSTTWRIRVANPRAASTTVASLTLDGLPQPDATFPLEDDGVEDEVEVVLGPRTLPAPAPSSDDRGRTPIIRTRASPGA